MSAWLRSATAVIASAPEIIQHAIWLYLRFTLSYRDVEELLAERGLGISYETVRRWVLKFGPAIARRAAPASSSAEIAGIGRNGGAQRIILFFTMSAPGCATNTLAAITAKKSRFPLAPRVRPSLPSGPSTRPEPGRDVEVLSDVGLKVSVPADSPATPLRQHPSRGLGEPGGRVADCASGIRGKHKALTDQAIHCCRNGVDIARSVRIPLLQR